jgi:hypothetical protein
VFMRGEDSCSLLFDLKIEKAAKTDHTKTKLAKEAAKESRSDSIKDQVEEMIYFDLI